MQLSGITACASQCDNCQPQVTPLLVDLVGEENTGRLADTIRLLVMQVGRMHGCELRGWVTTWAPTTKLSALFCEVKASGISLGTVPTCVLAQVDHAQKFNALMDAIALHAAGGKTIVFVNTKVRLRVALSIDSVAA